MQVDINYTTQPIVSNEAKVAVLALISLLYDGITDVEKWNTVLFRYLQNLHAFMIRYNNRNNINNNQLDTLIELWRLDPITDEYAGEKGNACKSVGCLRLCS